MTITKFNILKYQQIGLSTIICRYCNQKVTGDLDYQSYHFYICHPDKTRELIQRGLTYKQRQKYKTVDRAIEEFIHSMQPIHNRESRLI